MKLSEYTSLLELFAAFNFASVLSDKFMEALNGKIASPFKSLKRKFDTLNSNILLTNKGVYEDAPSPCNAHEKALQGEYSSMSELYKKTRKVFDAKESLNTLPFKSFSMLSLFSGLLCILLLMFCHFIDNRLSNTSFIITMYFLTFMCILFVLMNTLQIFFDWKSKFYVLSHQNAVLLLLTLIILSVIVFYILHFNLNVKNPLNALSIRILIALIIFSPVTHFTLIFTFSITRSRTEVKLQEIAFDNLQKEWNTFKKWPSR